MPKLIDFATHFADQSMTLTDLKFSSEELQKFNQFVDLTVYKNLSNLTSADVMRKGGVSIQFVYDKNYLLDMVNYFNQTG